MIEPDSSDSERKRKIEERRRVAREQLITALRNYENEETMQKYFVAFQYEDNTQGHRSLRYAYTFAKKRTEARKRAEQKLVKGQQILNVWTCEFNDPKSPLSMGRTNNGPPKVAQEIAESLLAQARTTYKVPLPKTAKKATVVSTPPAPKPEPKAVETSPAYTAPYTVQPAKGKLL